MRWRAFFAGMGCACIAVTSAAESGQDKLDETAKIQTMLSIAKSQETTFNSPEAEWQAAINYCAASRLGSIEAQYRLGMLYLVGKGVVDNQAYAAALFSLASGQGHLEALNMLDTVTLTSSELPPCVTGEILPERAVITTFNHQDNTADIDRQMAALPYSKRWIINLVDTIAARYQIDPKLVLAIIVVESNFEVRAQSPKAAMGLMQLIPDTAARFNIKNAFDAAQNIKGGVKYLGWLLAYYQGNVALAAAAYNAGEKTVDKYRGIPPYPETRKYVKRVLKLYRQPSHPYDEKLTKPSPYYTFKLQVR